MNLNLNPEAELAKLIAFPTRIPIKIIAEFRGHLHFGKKIIKNSAERYNSFLSAKANDPRIYTKYDYQNFLRISIRIPVRKVAYFA